MLRRFFPIFSVVGYDAVDGAVVSGVSWLVGGLRVAGLVRRVVMFFSFIAKIFDFVLRGFGERVIGGE